MNTSGLRGVGISAPTGFVHVSGYNRSKFQLYPETQTKPVGAEIPTSRKSDVLILACEDDVEALKIKKKKLFII